MYIDQIDHEKAHYMIYFMETILRKYRAVHLIALSNATSDSWF
jgi:hypothetical protein